MASLVQPEIKLNLTQEEKEEQERAEIEAQKEIKEDLIKQIEKQMESVESSWLELEEILKKREAGEDDEGDLEKAKAITTSLKRKEEVVYGMMRELEKKGGRRKRKKKTKKRKKKKTKRRRRRKNKTKRKKRKRKTKRRRKKGGLPYVKVKGQIWPSNAPVRIRVLGGDNDTVPAWINHL